MLSFPKLLTIGSYRNSQLMQKCKFWQHVLRCRMMVLTRGRLVQLWLQGPESMHSGSMARRGRAKPCHCALGRLTGDVCFLHGTALSGHGWITSERVKVNPLQNLILLYKISRTFSWPARMILLFGKKFLIEAFLSLLLCMIILGLTLFESWFQIQHKW